MKKLFFLCFLVISSTIIVGCGTKQTIQTKIKEETGTKIKTKNTINKISTGKGFINTGTNQKTNIINNNILSLKNKMTIKEIRNEYASINKNKDYKIIEKQLLGESTEGGQIKYFINKDNEIKKIITKYFGEMGNTIYEFYYKDGEIFFIFQQEKNYSKPIYYKGFDENDFTIEENRFYFSEGKLFKRLNNEKKEIDKNSKIFKDKGKELIKLSIKNLESIEN